MCKLSSPLRLAAPPLFVNCWLQLRLSDHQITIYDPEWEDQEAPDAAILTAALKGKSLLLQGQLLPSQVSNMLLLCDQQAPEPALQSS